MSDINIVQVPILALNPATYNPRKWDQVAIKNLSESIKRFGLIDPLIVNGSDERKNTVIGGHFRLKVAKDLNFKEVPVVYLNIPSEEKEKELNLRLNRNTGDWDWDLLAEFDETILKDIGFSSEELDDIFEMDDEPEKFDLEKELRKLQIDKIEVKPGDRYQLGGHILFCGDSMVEADVLNLMGEEKADMCLTDPPYILDYLKGKKKSDANEGFGFKRDRRYLGTDTLPPDFTEKWMANINKIQKENFSIIVYENWKNLRTIWSGMEKYWRMKNMIVWHLPNRVQGFAAKYKFFNKHDVAMVGASGTVEYNHDAEEESLQTEYETALYAISGKPQWKDTRKAKRYAQPTSLSSRLTMRSTQDKESYLERSQ